MSKKNRRKELEEQKASEGKVVVLKEKAEEKKEVAEVVKAAEKKVREPKNELKKTSAETMTLDDLTKWSSNQSKVIEGICSNLKKQAECISEHDERITALEEEVSEMKEYFEDDDEEDDEEPDVVEEEEEEAEDEESEESEEPAEMYLGAIIPEEYTGPAFAYLYLDEEAKKFIKTSSLLYAEAAAKDCTKWKVMPAWYEGGHIDHLLSTAELKKYAPR